MDVYLEIGNRRIFAAAVDWPGWCRSSRDERGALEALLAYGPRYRSAAGGAADELELPTAVNDLRIVERLAGDSSTDFGAPGGIPELDRAPVSDEDLDRLVAIHAACWRTFEHVAASVAGRTLRPAGPRGGGRSLLKIGEHVADAEAAYIRSIGGRHEGAGADSAALRAGFVAALRARAAGKLPDRGPRGGERWPPRYAVHRSAWHLLDHAWEIEDRSAD